ncbi:gamma-glutamyl-gamma-aminobutyrate hydrolase family protein [Lactobacillus xylocopicola]|uniref:Gamma-glutamyl-gamma-aminobutyrate hydrolase n=1 Tax=Lactobacillus xylocopicola TaxID=2976676 RepID=A0ABN6SPH0_9LACO|nr:gamma-glutamyl-gamma-aminobutyrate hydrolase family protein [Lactobacillus xylocopicola]BDR61197.1 gamma-glutamyl-gamma-aminobutyrate hydrolase [Lactobacillus xylocopicola]
MTRPIIGISGSVIVDSGGMFPGYRRSYVNEDYVDSVVQNGGVPFIIPFTADEAVIEAQLDQVQGLILSGGHDVDPHLYGEELLPQIGETWPERDHFDMLLLKLAEEKHKPILGICRGAQIINVAHGGSLYQDIGYRPEKTYKHDQGHTPDLPTHEVKVQTGSHLAQILGKTRFATNSFHHQLIKDVAPDLQAVACSSDGVTEGLENKAGNVVAVQWHPEMLHRNSNTKFMNNLFKFVIENAK